MTRQEIACSGVGQSLGQPCSALQAPRHDMLCESGKPALKRLSNCTCESCSSRHSSRVHACGHTLSGKALLFPAAVNPPPYKSSDAVLLTVCTSIWPLQDACAAACVTSVPLSCSEAMAKFRQLQLPHSSSCLMQPDGAVLDAGDVAAAVKQLAQNVGVLMRVSHSGVVPAVCCAVVVHHGGCTGGAWYVCVCVVCVWCVWCGVWCGVRMSLGFVLRVLRVAVRIHFPEVSPMKSLSTPTHSEQHLALHLALAA